MEPKTFKKSEIIEDLHKRYENYEPNFDEQNAKEKLFQIDGALVKQGLLNLCNMWNYSEQSRKFVKHIIASFIPPKTWNKILNFPEDVLKQKKNKCAIIGHYLAGISEIAEKGAMFITEKAQIMFNPQSDEAKTARETIRKEMAKWSKAVRLCQFAYFSPKSDKYLSNEGYIALQMFLEEALFSDEREIIFLMNKMRLNSGNKRLKNKHKMTNKEINQVAKAKTIGIASCVDDETMKKLKAIRDDKEAFSDNPEENSQAYED